MDLYKYLIVVSYYSYLALLFYLLQAKHFSMCLESLHKHYFLMTIQWPIIMDAQLFTFPLSYI